MSKIILMTIVLVFYCVISVAAQNCNFNKKNGIEKPQYAWAQNTLSAKTVQKIKGKILDALDEEVPATTIAIHQISGSGVKFIGSFETDIGGKFCFGGLKRGKYQITIGNQNFQGILMEINLEPKNKKAEKELVFNLEVGY